MIIEYFSLALIAILSIAIQIINKNKPSLIKTIIGLVLALSILLFIFIPILKDYSYAYVIYTNLYSVFLAITLLPKKISNNLTEYDYFELETAYKDNKDELEKLRQRYISTISLIDEGIIFYENGFEDVFLSDRAQELFGGEKGLKFSEHLESIEASDRYEYKKTIEQISKKSNSYVIKYKVVRDNRSFWVEEKGEFINVSNKKSIIATIRPLDRSIFRKTSYFDIDSLYTEERLYTHLKEMLNEHKSFSFIMFELTNIPEINTKYGVEAGNFMMNDYIRYLKASYQKDINKMFRVTGLKFAMIIEDSADYNDFHKALISKTSLLYNIKIQITGVKDTIKPNFGVINHRGDKATKPEDLISLANRELEEAKGSSRRNYAVFGE
ncbi:MAG: GGDEF domain-containing protein [Gammaproteobacteria bacterium]|nr:GGDEF domain-containing protein [Gammaproteobacteria bacterium]